MGLSACPAPWEQELRLSACPAPRHCESCALRGGRLCELKGQQIPLSVCAV